MAPFKIKSLEEYYDVYQKSVTNPEQFWEEYAQTFQWQRKWTCVLEWNFKEPQVKWFEGARLNITENCLDRHLAERGDAIAFIWEPNDPKSESKQLTYRQLHRKVMEMSAVMRQNGVKKGDRVIIYMNMILELPIALLACARIGAIHSVIFGGFSAQSIRDRINDAQATFVITQDAAWRGNKLIPLKKIMDEALEQCPSITKSIVVQHTKETVDWHPERDIWYHQTVEALGENLFIPAAPIDAEDPLFILYTSGSTGKPKGVVHTAGGYMINTAYTFDNVFQYTLDDVYFCTADIGWITGHSYIVYGPLLCGATVLLYEGVPSFPDAGRLWDIVAKHKVNILYTAPTALRSLMAFGDEYLVDKDFSSLKILGTVGEPINEEAWHWYKDKIGGGVLPIVDTWWQTETGAIMISNLAGVTPDIPSYATLPMPGVQPILVDDKGNEIEGLNVSGNLCVKFPWPGMIRTTYGDHERCRTAYFATYPNLYFTGDGAYRDERGFYRITGRVDDVLNVSGHRIGTAEVENALNEAETIVESAVVGFPHDVKGQAIYAFVKAEKGKVVDIEDALRQVIQKIGPFAKPDKIQIVSDLPKTRSGKIMRRILRKIAEQDIDNVGDTSTLLNPAIVDEIIQGRK